MINEPQLIIPDIHYKDSYLEALREGLELIPPSEEKVREIKSDFEGYRKREQHKGYGKLMLKLALPRAKKLGLNQVLITCNDNNTGSIKIIECFGSVLKKP